MLAFLDTESILLDILTTGATAALEARLNTHSDTGTVPPRREHSWLHSVKNKVFRRSRGKGKYRDGDSRTTPNTSQDVLTLIRSPMNLRTTIIQLQNRSLIASQSHTPLTTLRIHDLIQLIVLENTKKDRTEQEWFQCAVEIACSAFGQIEDHSSPKCWLQCETLVPHIQALRLRQEISGDIKVQLISATRQLATYLHGRGRLEEAAKLYGDVLADAQHLFGSEDPHTLNAMNDYAWSHLYCGRVNDAGVLLERVLQARDERLGSEHLDTLNTMYRLAMVRITQERPDEAEALLIRALPHQERQLGLEHHQTLLTVSGLGRVYGSQGRYEDAASVLRRALLGFERVLGLEHRDTLAAMYRLACVFRLDKRYGEAEDLLKRVVVSRQSLLGPNHYQTLKTMHELALVYNSTGNHDDAEALLKQVLLGQEQQLASDHFDILVTKHSLAVIYNSQGRHTEAEALLAPVSEAWERFLGQSHPRTHASIGLLASVRKNLAGMRTE
jgi:tetratricopeptide (TPR) repeat protein